MTNGLVSGTTWNPMSIMVKEDESGTKFHYTVDGIRTWTLLGVTIFSESKSYKGIVDIK